MSSPERRRIRQDELLALLIEAVQDYAIFLLSPDGEVQTWNLGAERIKGYTADEILGRHFSAFYTPEDRSAGRPMRLLAAAAEHGRVEDEGWRLRKDGSRFWADVVLTAIRDRQGELIGFGKVTRDLTERRAAEEQQRTLAVEQEARQAAERGLEARDRFLSIASHELKTPVASIQLATDSLLRAYHVGRLDGDRLKRGLERLATANRRLNALVAELLDVSLLTTRSPTLTLEAGDLVELTRDVIARFEGLADEGRVRLSAPSSLPLRMDASRMDQVLTNLLDNALKYSDAPSPVDVELAEAEGGVRIVVADQGIGIDSETADRIFEAFGRAANAEHVPGLGLGLYIAHQIIARHGGRIRAVVRPDGPGARFEVWLPGVPKAEPA